VDPRLQLFTHLTLFPLILLLFTFSFLFSTFLLFTFISPCQGHAERRRGKLYLTILNFFPESPIRTSYINFPYIYRRIILFKPACLIYTEEGREQAP